MNKGKRPTYEVAMDRFFRDQCPLCGRGKGEPKGIEKRIKMEDLYCHNCKRPWTSKTVLDLKHELPTNINGISPIPAAAKPPFFTRFLGRIRMLVG